MVTAAALPLPEAKTRPPKRGADGLRRHRLVNALLERSDHKLMFVVAPAGCGKTTLLYYQLFRDFLRTRLLREDPARFHLLHECAAPYFREGCDWPPAAACLQRHHYPSREAAGSDTRGEAATSRPLKQRVPGRMRVIVDASDVHQAMQIIEQRAAYVEGVPMQPQPAVSAGPTDASPGRTDLEAHPELVGR